MSSIDSIGRGVPDALPSVRLEVKPAWIDLYGHMNAARYVEVFDGRGFELLEQFDVGESYTRESRNGIYTVRLDICYLEELLVTEELELKARLLAVDSKRLLTLFELYRMRDERLVATMEQLSLHVNLETRKVVPFSRALHTNLIAIVEANSKHALPPRFVRQLKLKQNC
jgi:acyl-CoA thioester hydrolase